MGIYYLARHLEMVFWKAVLPAMEKEGFIMKLTRYVYQAIHTKIGYMLLLIIVWGAVGFVLGLLLGQILTLFELVTLLKKHAH